MGSGSERRNLGPPRGSPALHRHGPEDWGDSRGDRRVNSLNWEGLRQSIRRLARWEGAQWIASIVVVLVVGIVLAWVFWDCLHDGRESLSSTIRNLALVIGGVIAGLLAVWRSRVAERQAAAARGQVEAAQQGLLNERYQRGAEMLGSDVLSVRLGGIYALQRLANEHPQEYHVPIMQLLCAFVRHPTRDQSELAEPAANNSESGHEDNRDDAHTFAREDVYAVTQIIRTRNRRVIRLEDEAGYALDLRGADLRRSDFRDSHLPRSDLRLARLSGAQLINADLSGARLQRADLSSPLGATSMDTKDPTDLKNIDLTDITRLDGAVLSDIEAFGANFSSAILDGVDLSGESLLLVNLSGSRLMNVDLSNTNLWRADLSGAELHGAKLFGADLQHAILSATDLSGSYLSGHAVTPKRPVSGLTQDQIDKACADRGNPPRLDSVLDADTGEQLVWRGKVPDDTPD